MSDVAAVVLKEVKFKEVLLPESVARLLRLRWNATVQVEGFQALNVPDGVFVDQEGDVTSYFLTEEEIQPDRLNPKLAAVLQACADADVRVLHYEVECVPELREKAGTAVLVQAA